MVRCQGVEVYRAPGWRVLTTPLHHLCLDRVGPLYECQQIRSYKSTAVILFTEKKSEQVSSFKSLTTYVLYHNHFTWLGIYQRIASVVSKSLIISSIVLNLVKDLMEPYTPHLDPLQWIWVRCTLKYNRKYIETSA